MPFDYKSLAQLKPSGAKAPELFNLIKNPAFDSCSLEPWRMSANSRNITTSIRFFLNEQLLTSAYTDPGFNPTTWGSPRCAQFSASDSGAPALWTGFNPWLSLTQTQVCPYPEDLVPAKPNQNYHFAFSLMRWSSNTASTYRLRVVEWDSDYRFTGTIRDLDFSSDFALTGASNKWQRVFSTFTTTDSCQYFSFAFYKTASDNIYHMFSDLYVGEYAEYAQSPFNSLTQDLTYAYPFDKRKFGYIGEYGKSYTGQTFSGNPELLYTVPSEKSAIISSIIVNNMGKINSPYRIAIIPNGRNLESLQLDDFICFDETINPRESLTRAEGITLSAGDKIYVSSDSGEINFNLFGSEAS